MTQNSEIERIAKGLTEDEIAAACLVIAHAADDLACQAGVGGMETAGSIVSYIAKKPTAAKVFRGGSMMDWPPDWHVSGILSWHGQNGQIYSPEYVRRAKVIKGMQGQIHDEG